MLQAAGFVSVTESQLRAYLAGTAVLPRRSVLIAFDGGRERDWTVADGLLARYGFSATVFVDPARLTGRGSGYLSWTQLEQMAASGRWSVGLDLSDAGTKVALDASGTAGPAVVSHAWLPEAQRSETTAEFTARIRTVLQGEIGE